MHFNVLLVCVLDESINTALSKVKLFMFQIHPGYFLVKLDIVSYLETYYQYDNAFELKKNEII